MPQRAKTPPPPQDEIFMTISHPYPQHANMEVQEDIERVARWLGTIVAPGHFNAFYHKPSVSVAFRVRHDTFSPLARSVLETLIPAVHISTHAGDYEFSVLAPVYPDRHRRVTDIDAMDCSFSLLRHATRSSSKFQSAYAVSVFLYPLRPSSANWFLSFEQSDRGRQTQAPGKTHLERVLVEPFRGREGARVRRILLRLSKHQGRPERRYGERPCGVSVRRSNFSFS